MAKETKNRTAKGKPSSTKNNRSKGGNQNRQKKKVAKKPPVRKKLQARKKYLNEISEIEQQIKEVVLNYEGAIKNHSERSIVLGKYFNQLKDPVSKSNIGWTEYLEENWPFYSVRSIQRWTLVAAHTDIRNYPTLSYLAMYKLEELIEHLKKTVKWKEEIGKTLVEYGIDPSLVKNSHKSIVDFKIEVDDLLDTLIVGDPFKEAESSDYKHPHPHAAKEIVKLSKKIERKGKRNLRKQGKIEKKELERSIQRNISSLKRNLHTFLYRHDKIIGEPGTPLEISIIDLKELDKLIKKILSRAKKNINHFKDPDIPDEDDI